MLEDAMLYNSSSVRSRISTIIILIIIPIQVPSHGNLPHRHHPLLTTLAAPVIMLTRHRHRRHGAIIPRLLTLDAAALVDGLTAIATTAAVAADEGAGTARVFGSFEVLETARAGVAAAAGEAGAEAPGQVVAEERSEHGQAGGEDANVAFAIQPDGGVDDGVWWGALSEGLASFWEKGNVHVISFGVNSPIKGTRTMLPIVALRRGVGVSFGRIYL